MKAEVFHTGMLQKSYKSIGNLSGIQSCNGAFGILDSIYHIIWKFYMHDVSGHMSRVQSTDFATAHGSECCQKNRNFHFCSLGDVHDRFACKI